MQRRDAARRFLVVAEIENPGLVLIAADWIGSWPSRIAIPLLLTALLDQFADINVCIATHHDIVTTRTQRIT